MNIFELLLHYVRHTGRLLLGIIVFSVTGKTPGYAYQSMIRLFCMSSGRSNDVLSNAVEMLHPKYKIHKAEGVLGDVAESELIRIASVIATQGYYVFPQQLPTALCDRLFDFALESECLASPTDHDPPGTPARRVARYERESPTAVRYDFDAQMVIDNADVQQLMADASLLALAQCYLGCRPVMDVMTMWWHTKHSANPDKIAAQFYHFDMDRLKWLKIFIYLTDVGPHSGPHYFVAGSHRSGGIPERLRSKGYVRLTDQEVEDCYPRESFIEFTGRRGTIIAEDTRGLHKGQHVLQGDRLMLQLQYSNSLFGGAYPQKRIHNIASADLGHMASLYPRLYSAYR